MIKKKVLILGASGQIGKHLIRKLTKNNYKAICQTRNAHKSVFLKTSGQLGYIDILELNIFDSKKLEQAISSADICINLIGILFEKGKINTFRNIHTKLPEIISSICEKYKVQFIHFSALGVEKAKDSEYARSKINGENKILENNNEAVIIKPSIVFSVSDSFTTKFLSYLSYLPFFPLYYGGKTKFMPIHASDVADLIYYVVSENIKSKKIEALGPETITFKEMLSIMLKCINKKKLLIPMPLSLAKISASFLQLMPNPILTIDQLKLLKYDNIKSDGAFTNTDAGLPGKIKFEEGIMRYSYNWREGGQYNFKKIN